MQGGGGWGQSPSPPPIKRQPKKKERERKKKGEDVGRKRITSRERYNESSSISNNLMKRQSFRTTRGSRKRKSLIQTRIRVENGTMNRLLSLII